MAISLKDIYAYIVGASASYPWGSFKNASAPGALDGTPFEKQWANDIYGFLQALLSKAGIVPSGAPDTAQVSQYLQAIQFLIGQAVPVGVSYFTFLVTPPVGYLELNGGTIGDAASGASERANADMQALFTTLWTLTATDPPGVGLTIRTSAGVVTTAGGSAAADWAAHKRINLPDMRGVVARGWDHGRGLDIAGRIPGNYQDDAQQNITGTFTVDDGMMSNVGGAFYDAGGYNYDADSRGGGGHILGFDASRQVRTANEVRMKNVVGMWIIKY